MAANMALLSQALKRQLTWRCNATCRASHSCQVPPRPVPPRPPPVAPPKTLPPRLPHAIVKNKVAPRQLLLLLLLLLPAAALALLLRRRRRPRLQLSIAPGVLPATAPLARVHVLQDSYSLLPGCVGWRVVTRGHRDCGEGRGGGGAGGDTR